MQLISCHNGRLFTDSRESDFKNIPSFRTELSAIDDLLPHRRFAREAIHEILSEPGQPVPKFFALLLARATSGVIIWCDPQQTLYPPAIAAAGVPLEKLYLLHPKNQADQSWAIAECMRCKGVGATIAQIPRLSRLEARRLQLSAERGGGVGLLLRPFDRNASTYAAATRWLVSSIPGLRSVQRWKIQLIHAHGGRIGQTVILEHSRETNLVRAVEQLADRQVETKESIRISA
jgi:protein ImuA